MSEKYDVVMACGCAVRNVCAYPMDRGEKLIVMDPDNMPKHKPVDDDGKMAPCLRCPCKRKAKRVERKYMVDWDTGQKGLYVVCMPVENRPVKD